jgi:cytochrome b561
MEAQGFAQYGPPSTQYGPHRAMNPADPPRELSGLAWGVFVSLGVVAILAVVRIVTAFNLHSAAAPDAISTPTELESVHHTYAVWIGFYGIAFLVSALVFVAWFYRAYRNLRRLGVLNLRYGDGWALGAWFIPFFNMVRPKQIANDVWRGSEPGVDVLTQWRQVEVPSLVHWWWALYLIQGALVYIGQRITTSGYDKLSAFGTFSSGVSQMRSGTVVEILGEVVAIAAVVLAIKFVSQVTERLEQVRGTALMAGAVDPIAQYGLSPAATYPPAPQYPPQAPQYPPQAPSPPSGFSPPPPPPPPPPPVE